MVLATFCLGDATESMCQQINVRDFLADDTCRLKEESNQSIKDVTVFEGQLAHLTKLRFSIRKTNKMRAAKYLEAEEEERNLLLHGASDGLWLVVDKGGCQGHENVQHAPHRPKYICGQSPADHKMIVFALKKIYDRQSSIATSSNPPLHDLKSELTSVCSCRSQSSRGMTNNDKVLL